MVNLVTVCVFIWMHEWMTELWIFESFFSFSRKAKKSEISKNFFSSVILQQQKKEEGRKKNSKIADFFSVLPNDYSIQEKQTGKQKYWMFSASGKKTQDKHKWKCHLKRLFFPFGTRKKDFNFNKPKIMEFSNRNP